MNSKQGVVQPRNVFEAYKSIVNFLVRRDLLVHYHIVFGKLGVRSLILYMDKDMDYSQTLEELKYNLALWVNFNAYYEENNGEVKITLKQLF